MPDFGTNIAGALTYLRGNPAEVAYLFILPNSATGDLSHVLPVMKNPQMKVLVMGGTSDKEAEPHNGRMNLAQILVREFGVPEGQVARAVSLTKGQVSKDGAASTSDVKTAIQKKNINFSQIYDLGDASKIIRWQYLNQDAETAFSGQTGNVPWSVLGNSPDGPILREPTDLKAAMYGTSNGPGGLTDDDKGRFDAMLQSAKIETLDKPLVVLWGRSAPKVGGAHYYGNHSNVAWGQVTSRCIQKGYAVLLAGQYKADPRPDHETLKDAYYIGEFYKNPYMPRIKQLCFFDHIKLKLAEAGKKFLHVGMRSGGLDFYGFAGQPILYIAYEKMIADFQTNEMKAKFDERMSRVEGAFKESGETSYNRVGISQPPKRWSTANGTVAKVDQARKDLGDDAKGFKPEDLDRVMSEIGRLLA